MRLIKRYSNRKLYDTQAKAYVTLEEIARLVREGEDIQVVDNQSGDDLTKVTLSQILLEQEKRKETSLTKSFFVNLIKRSQSSATEMVDAIRRNVSTWFDATFFSDEKTVEERVDSMVEGGEISKEEARKLKDEFKARMEGFRAKVDEVVERRVRHVLGALNIPTKAEVEALDARLDDLARRLDDALEKKAQGPEG